LNILYQLAFYKESQLIIRMYKSLMIEAKNQITIYKNIKNLNNLLKIKIIINQDNISEDFSFKYIIKL
jgi:hypothetical protein